jgi:hypothetical protein
MSIAAMKQALEFIKAGSAKYAVDTLEAAIAEQEKAEPVAWAAQVGGFAVHTEWGKRPDNNIHNTALYTHPAQPPEGWQLVPVEPTKEMVGNEYNREMLATIWKSMLAASPKPGEMK